MCVYVYKDASAKGKDAMTWLGIVSVLGIIGLVIWLATRPQPVRYVWLPYWYYPYPGWHPPQPYMPAPRYVPPPGPQQPYDRTPVYPPPPGAPHSYQPTPPEPRSTDPADRTGPAPAVVYAYPRVRDPAGPPGVRPAPSPAGSQWMPPPTGAPPTLPPTGWPPPPFHPAGPRPPAQPGYRPFAVRRMIATLVAAMALTVFVELPIVFLIAAQVPDWTEDPTALLSQLLSPGLLLVFVAIQDALLVGLTYISIFRPGHLTLRDIGATAEARLPRGALIGLLAGLALFAAASGIGWLLERTGWFSEGEGIIQVGTPSGLAFTLVATVVIAPVAEELFFRGYAVPVLERRWGAAAGVALSALMFTVMHLSLFQFLPIFVAGVGLALLFRRWGIAPCIVAHGVNNFLAVVLMYLGYG
ncbi:MAG: CPBP family intramembrane metalloprotease [Euryarchaeota archaeon]|nr:CPBP family intramembrane metalloprotease [Euryarchaeota archaeon]